MSFSMSRRSFLVRSAQVAASASVAGALLAACGGSSSSGPATLTYGWWSNSPDHDNAMRAWIKDFEKVNPDVKIKPEILPWANYWEKVQTTTAGGNAYDIIGMAGGNFPTYADKNVLYDLSQYSDYHDSAKALSAPVVQTTLWNDKPYAMPVGVYVPTLGYDKNLLSAAGVAPLDAATPITFDDFKSIGMKITKKQGNTYTQYALNPAYFMEIDTFVFMEGGSVYDRLINPTKVTINTPEGIAGLKDYLSLYTENIAIPPDQQTNGPWGAGDISSLTTGKVAFARTGAYDFSQLLTSATNVGIAPLYSINGKRAVVGGANSLTVYRGSKHADAGWAFLKWATQMQPQLKFSTFSDLPANLAAQTKLDTVITPKEFIPALLSNLSAFKPGVMTKNQQISSVFGDITTDLLTGKITPEQAAAQMEQKGNAALASS